MCALFSSPTCACLTVDFAQRQPGVGGSGVGGGDDLAVGPDAIGDFDAGAKRVHAEQASSKSADVVNAVQLVLGSAGVSAGPLPVVRVAGTGETSVSLPSEAGKETVRVKVCARVAVRAGVRLVVARPSRLVCFLILTGCPSACTVDTRGTHARRSAVSPALRFLCQPLLHHVNNVVVTRRASLNADPALVLSVHVPRLWLFLTRRSR